MPTTTIELTDEEAAELDALRSATGEPAAALLKRAAVRGVKELRLEQALLAYERDGDSTAAAEIAGLPRAVFLWLLAEHGVPMLTGPSTLADGLDFLASRLDNPRLAAAARALAEAAD